MNAGTRWLGRSMLLAGLALGALSVPRHAAAEGSFVVSVVDSAGATGYGASIFDLRVFPNPASSEVTVEFAGLPDGPVEIEVLDLMGRARRLDHRLASRGRLRSTMDLNGLPDGVYFVRARAGGTRLVRRLVVTARR